MNQASATVSERKNLDTEHIVQELISTTGKGKDLTGKRFKVDLSTLTIEEVNEELEVPSEASENSPDTHTMTQLKERDDALYSAVCGLLNFVNGQGEINELVTIPQDICMQGTDTSQKGLTYFQKLGNTPNLN